MTVIYEEIVLFLLQYLTLLHSNVYAWFPAPAKKEGAGNQAEGFELFKYALGLPIGITL